MTKCFPGGWRTDKKLSQLENTFILASSSPASKQRTDTIKLKYTGPFFILRTKELHLSNSCSTCTVSTLRGLDLLAFLLDNKMQRERGNAALGGTTYIAEPVHSGPPQDPISQRKRKLCPHRQALSLPGSWASPTEQSIFFWIL